MEEFDLSRAILRHAQELCRGIRHPRKRKAVVAEYIEHMEDATHAYMMRGMGDAEAFRAAAADLGDIGKTQILLALTHNGDGLPRWFKWVMGTLGAVAFGVAYATVENKTARAWMQVALIAIAVAGGIALVGALGLFLRAVFKRASAERRLRAAAEARGMTFVRHKNPYVSLLRPSATPEWTVESAHTRYIIRLWPTFYPRRVIRLQENGLYTCNKRSFFLMRFGFGSYSMPPSWYPAPGIELPRGIYRMPHIEYERFHSPDKENRHIILLNPIPLEVTLTGGGRVRLDPDISLGEAYGYARVCSAADLVRCLGLEKN